MPSIAIVAAVVLPTIVVAVLIWSMSRKCDAILLMLSGAASLILAVVASNAMQVQSEGGMMALEMSTTSFNLGVLPPVFIVATLTVMRGLFKFFQE